MGKLPEPTYEEQKKHNELLFKEHLKKVRPELFVLMDILDTTNVNPLIVWKVIRQLNMIAIGSKFGVITIEIKNGIVTFVRGEEHDKVNEEIIRKEE